MQSGREYIYTYDDTVIHRIVYEPVRSNMYVLCEDRKMLIIDPNRNIDGMLKRYDPDEIRILLTHEDYDHTNGIPYIPDRYNPTIICHRFCADKIQNPRNNRPLLVLQVLAEKYGKASREVNEEKEAYAVYTVDPDIVFDQEYNLLFADHRIRMVYTPGHTKGSCCIEMDKQFIFTGDTLLMDNSSITRFRGSDKKLYMESAKPYIAGIPDGTTILPGHGDPFYIEELREEQ